MLILLGDVGNVENVENVGNVEFWILSGTGEIDEGYFHSPITVYGY